MASGFQEVLVFELAGQRFGLPGSLVRELLRAVQITPLSDGGAGPIEGIINIRGQIVSVYDLRRWLRLPAKPVEPSDHIVVISSGARTAALRVDRAVDLTRLEVSLVAADESSLESVVGDQIAKSPDGLVLLPDVRGLLAQGDLGSSRHTPCAVADGTRSVPSTDGEGGQP